MSGRCSYVRNLHVSSCEKRAWKIFRLEQDSNPLCLWYKCSALRNWAIKPTGRPNHRRKVIPQNPLPRVFSLSFFYYLTLHVLCFHAVVKEDASQNKQDELRFALHSPFLLSICYSRSINNAICLAIAFKAGARTGEWTGESGMRAKRGITVEEREKQRLLGRLVLLWPLERLLLSFDDTLACLVKLPEVLVSCFKFKLTTQFVKWLHW